MTNSNLNHTSADSNHTSADSNHTSSLDRIPVVYTGNDYLDNFLSAEIDLLVAVPDLRLVPVLDQGLRAILTTQLELIRVAHSVSSDQKQQAIRIVEGYLDESQWSRN